MALSKTIIQNDGVPTNYHRIFFVQQTVNQQTSIAVLSYVNEENRIEDLDKMIYKKSTTYEIPYDETMTIEKAYEYLKTLPEFEGAEDV